MNRSNTEDFMAGVHHEQNQQPDDETFFNKDHRYQLLGELIRGGADVLAEANYPDEALAYFYELYDDPDFDPGNYQRITILDRKTMKSVEPKPR